MADDPDAPFHPGPTTRRGLLSAFGRRAARSLPIPDVPEVLLPRSPESFFDEEPPHRIEPLLSGEEFVAEVRASVGETGMHIWWLGQSGFLIQIAGKNIVLDPYLSDTMTWLYANTETPFERITGLVVEPALLSFVDVVTCTNARFDHLDPGTLPGILAESAAFVCAAGAEETALERAGKEPDAAIGLWDQIEQGSFFLHGVPAHHGDAPESVGLVVRSGAYAFYYAGDSRRVQGMAEAVSPHGVDVAFLPINGCNGNMDGADAARLAYEAGAQIAIPCHHEMFRNDTAGVSRFVAECVRIGQEYRLPRVGERVTIDYGY